MTGGGKKSRIGGAVIVYMLFIALIFLICANSSYKGNEVEELLIEKELLDSFDNED